MICCHCEVCSGQAVFFTPTEFDDAHPVGDQIMLVELVTETERRPYTASVDSVRQMFEWRSPQ